MSAKGVCIICKEKCTDVWTTHPCKHVACCKCLTSLMNVKTCPACGQRIGSLSCPGGQYGCTFDTRQGSWKDHLAACLRLPMECPYRCEALVTKETLLSHITTSCSLRLATCRFCAKSVFHIEIRDHESSCPESPVTCPYCELEGIKRGKLLEHAAGCWKTPKPCPLQEYGCDFSGLVDDIDKHLNVKNHIACFRQLKEEQEERKSEVCHLRSELDSCKNRLAELACGDGAIAFYEKIVWMFQASTLGAGVVFSPPYHLAGSLDVLCLKLEFNCTYSGTGGYSRRSSQLQKGDTVNLKIFQYWTRSGTSGNAGRCYAVSVHSHNHDHFHLFGMRSEVARKAGLRQTDEKIVDCEVQVGIPYVISYWKEQ